MNLDRFSQGLPDLQDVLPVTYCKHCGGEVYPGEEVYCIDGFYVVHDECICDFIYENPRCGIDIDILAKVVADELVGVS